MGIDVSDVVEVFDVNGKTVYVTKATVIEAFQKLPPPAPAPTFPNGTIVGYMSARGPAAVGVVIPVAEGSIALKPGYVWVTDGVDYLAWPAKDVQEMGRLSDFIGKVTMTGADFLKTASAVQATKTVVVTNR